MAGAAWVRARSAWVLAPAAIWASMAGSQKPGMLGGAVGAGDECGAAEGAEEEIGRGGVVGIPRGQAGLDVVVGVLDVGELDVAREGAEFGVEADAGEGVAEVGADEAADRAVVGDQRDACQGGGGVGGAGGLDEGASLGRVVRVGAGRDVAGQAGREILAAGDGEFGAAEEFDEGIAVDGEVDGVADADVVEGRQMDVEGDEPEGGGRVQVDLVEVVLAELAEAVGWGTVEHPVGLVVEDGGQFGFVLEAEFIVDPVGAAGGLGFGVPGMEVLVADELEAVVGVVGGEAIGAGAGDGGGAGVVGRGVGGEDAGVGEG